MLRTGGMIGGLRRCLRKVGGVFGKFLNIVNGENACMGPRDPLGGKRHAQYFIGYSSNGMLRAVISVIIGGVVDALGGAGGWD